MGLDQGGRGEGKPLIQADILVAVCTVLVLDPSMSLFRDAHQS